MTQDKRISQFKYMRGCNLLYEAVGMAIEMLMSEHIITNTNLKAVALLQATQGEYKDIMQTKRVRG